MRLQGLNLKKKYYLIFNMGFKALQNEFAHNGLWGERQYGSVQ